MSTFADYRYKSQPALGRQAIIDQIVRELGTRRLNLVGARGTGKSCVARAVRNDPRVAQAFHGIVFCDLKEHAPDGDDAFFKSLISDMYRQLPDTVSKGLLDPKFPFDEALNETAEAWEGNKQRVLIILDGVDDAFLSLGDGWSFLCGWVEKISVQFLCTSRRRIRELCNTRAKRDSLMHQRFKNPLEMQPLNTTDLGLIASIGGQPAAGVFTALATWTGGHAGLTVALCDEALCHGNSGDLLTVDGINKAAQSMISTCCEELELVWEDIKPDERELFITACRAGEVPAASSNGARLQKLGFLHSESGVLKPYSRLMADFAGKEANGVSLFREWFGTETRMLSSMKQVLLLRLGASYDSEPDLITNVRDAIEAIERPDKAARAFRDIVKEALDLVWDVETPNREVPYFTKGGGPNWLVGARSWPRDNKGFSDLLDLMTHDKYWASPPKRLNRKIFSMISFLYTRVTSKIIRTIRP